MRSYCCYTLCTIPPPTAPYMHCCPSLALAVAHPRAVLRTAANLHIILTTHSASYAAAHAPHLQHGPALVLAGVKVPGPRHAVPRGGRAGGQVSLGRGLVVARDPGDGGRGNRRCRAEHMGRSVGKSMCMCMQVGSTPNKSTDTTTGASAGSATQPCGSRRAAGSTQHGFGVKFV